jgi:hypothetical protein
MNPSAALKDKLDTDLGFYYWKYYIAGAFWSNIATPINLCITILSALVSAQANTESLLPNNLYKDLSIALLLLSTLNTFLRPHIQMNENVQLKQKYDALGAEFEQVHFSQGTDAMKYGKYEIIAKQMNDLRKSDSPISQNYLTDLIHIICRQTCLKGKNLWLELLYIQSENQETQTTPEKPVDNDIDDENMLVQENI